MSDYSKQFKEEQSLINTGASTIIKNQKIMADLKTTYMGMQLKNGFSVSEYFTAYPKFLHDVAKGYDAIMIF